MTRIPIRGNQYATGHYGKILPATALTPSMSRKSKYRDKAPRVSFFGTLKTGPVHQREYPNRDAARRDPFPDSERDDNPRPSHSAIGCLTPQQADRKTP